MKKILASLLILFFAPLLFAVMGQHDIPRERYQALAQKSTFDGVVFLQFKKGFCTGTVIAPRVVLTATHCLSGLLFSELTGIEKNEQLSTIKINEQRFGFVTLASPVAGESDDDKHYMTGARVNARCLVPPEQDQVQFRVADNCHDDVALVYLDRPIFLDHYLPVLRGSDAHDYVAQNVELAGYGEFATGISGPPVKLFTKLAAKMSIDSIENKGGRSYFRSTFTMGDKASLLGAPAKGDSGTALIANFNGEDMIIGVYSSTLRPTGDRLLATFERITRTLIDENKLTEQDYRTLAMQRSNKENKFYGYGSERLFSFIGDYEDLLDMGISSIAVESEEPLFDDKHHLWSAHQDTWNSEKKVTEKLKRDPKGALRRHFNVTIKSPVTLDVDAEIDATKIVANGHLRISHGKTLSSYHFQATEGDVMLNGSLLTTNFILRDNAVLSGSGTIRVVSPPSWKKEIMNQVRGTLKNESGIVSLFSPATDNNSSAEYEQLIIDGTYEHGADVNDNSVTAAHLHMGINPVGASSQLNVYGDINLKGGDLQIEISSNNSEERIIQQTTTRPRTRHKSWPLILANGHIHSQFDEARVNVRRNDARNYALLYENNTIYLIAQ